MSTMSLPRLEVSMQPAPPPSEFAAFRRYLILDHARIGNAERTINREPVPLRLHARHDGLGEQGYNQPFTESFARYLQAGVDDEKRRASEEWSRHRVVEAAVKRVEIAAPHLVAVLRWVQTPRYLRTLTAAGLAGTLGTTERTIFLWRDRAVQAVWWELGEVW